MTTRAAAAWPIVALTMAGGAVVVALTQRGRTAPPTPASPELHATVARLEQALDRHADALDSAARERAWLRARLADAPAGERSAAPARDAAAPAPIATPAATTPSTEPAPTDTHTNPDDEPAFRAMLARVLGIASDATPEEQTRFWEMARSSGHLARIIESLEDRIADDPKDAAARMQLADAYVAKLLTVPAGPERGVWGMKAEAQWKAVAERDPNHWESQYRLGENWSHYPDFMNKTADAIGAFERARTIFEASPPDPRQAGAYVQLARLYLKQGNTDLARQVLGAGTARFPGDEAIRDALRTLPPRNQ